MAIKSYNNTTLNDEIYRITKTDINSIHELLTNTHSFQLQCIGEKQLPNNHKLFIISAPSTGNSNYSGDGHTIAEAVERWFDRVEKCANMKRKPQKKKIKVTMSIIDKVTVAIKSYFSTLFSTLMIGFAIIHTLEDILLMSIGRFVPLPLFVMYALGLVVSWLVMGCLVNKVLGVKHKH